MPSKAALLRAKLNGEISQRGYAQTNAEFDCEISVIEKRLQTAQADHVTRAAFLRSPPPCCSTSLVPGNVREQNRECVFKIFCFKVVCTTRRNCESLNTLTHACSIRWRK
jgi:hypothetical protein